MLNHLNINLYGKVQGVFLRRTVEHEAERKGISGFVRNEKDGTVYIEAEGPEAVLNEFVSWLKSGAGAEEGEADYKIAQVDVQNGKFGALEGFEIK